jgi:acetylornithine/succinyldiaminopimelate/putrescine aminotransferase
VHYIADAVGAGLRDIRDDHPDWFTGIRQDGVVLGLEFGHPEGAKHVMRELYETGVWAIFSSLDPRVLQFKPGILMTPDLVEELLDRVAVGVARAARRAAPVGRGAA